MSHRIFITVAETSGDKHAAALIRSLKTLDPTIEIEGFGGPEMATAGATILRETVKDAAMTVHGVKRVFEVRRLLKEASQIYAARKPDLQICVDSSAMNLHFAKRAKAAGVPVLYYVAPQLWASREGRMKHLRADVDQLACILPFEEDYFREHGVNATFAGHPLFDSLPTDRPAKSLDELQAGRPTIGIIPGSRRSEVRANLPHLLEVAGKIVERFPGARFVIPTTPAVDALVRETLTGPLARVLVGESWGEGNERSERRDVLKEEALTPALSHEYTGEGVATPANQATRDSKALSPALSPNTGRGWNFTVKLNAFDELIPQCDLCLCKSGTSTLHVAAYGVPMIVVYRVSPILWHAAGRWLIKTKKIALVNILAGQIDLVPEFIPWYGSNQPVADCAIDLLTHPEKLVAQRQKLNDLVATLDRKGASMNVARLAIGMMEREKEKRKANTDFTDDAD